MDARLTLWYRSSAPHSSAANLSTLGNDDWLACSRSGMLGHPLFVRPGNPRPARVLGVSTPNRSVAVNASCGHDRDCWSRHRSTGQRRPARYLDARRSPEMNSVARNP